MSDGIVQVALAFPIVQVRGNALLLHQGKEDQKAAIGGGLQLGAGQGADGREQEVLTTGVADGVGVEQFLVGFRKAVQGAAGQRKDGRGPSVGRGELVGGQAQGRKRLVEDGLAWTS